MKRNQQIRAVLFSVLLAGLVIRMMQSGGFSHSAGYVLLLAAAVVGAAYFSRRQKQRAAADPFCHLSKSEMPSVCFADVAANEEALEAMKDLVSFIRQPEQYARLGARIPRGVLLYGLPGTGKTLMARALAGEAGVPFFAVNGADFVEMYVGVGASRIRTLFQKARKAGRAVIFFDEIDAIGKKRDNRSDEREQTLNALLSEMSGFGQSDGVVVVAATNRVDTLDEALLRAGRFDRQIEVPLPGLEERRRILEVHARRMPVAPEVSFGELARQTALFSGAKLECLLNEAAILAAKRGAEEIGQTDVQTAMDRSLFGTERRGSGKLERERHVTAAHEAGHAIATAVLLKDNELTKVSIIPTSRGAAGYSLSLPAEKMFHEKAELLSHIAAYPPALSRILKHIHEHYTDAITLADLSDIFGLSRQYIMRLFQRHLSITVTQYITQLKMSHALELLRHSTFRVGEVAEMLGYSNNYYFCRLFRRQFGMSPTEYIRHGMNNDK